jgi:sodium transport system ATP-binding protein
MLRAESLRKVFYPPRGAAVEAVRGATFSVEPGEVFGLLGPNGAGKTTLLRMLGTIISPTSGHCWVGDVRTDEAKDDIRKDIGFLSGNTKLYGRLTATEVLRYFGRLYGMEESLINVRIETLAGMLDMKPFLDRRCEALSTGQTQKVSIARVILHDPKVLILDEPTMGLDIMTSRAILDFIRDAKGRGHSIIFSTHYMTEAEMLCDRVGLIYKGDLLAVGTMGELYEKSGANNLQQAFLNLVGEETEVSE